SSMFAPSSPIMWGMATFTIDVSMTWMSDANTTAMAMNHRCGSPRFSVGGGGGGLAPPRRAAPSVLGPTCVAVTLGVFGRYARLVGHNSNQTQILSILA